MLSLSEMLLQWCLVLVCSFVIVFIFVKYRRKSYGSPSIICDADQKAVFENLQYRYLCGFTAACFADWLYGPYIFQLYLHYGYDSKTISILYIAGFFSSMIFGTLVGYLADSYGRRKMCLCYNIFGILSSLCKTSPSFNVLFIGHILSGINASILSSVFSVWYMHEHLERLHFPREWLNATFTTATFLNGILAIMAGAVADIGVHFAQNQPVAPFFLMIPIFIISASYIFEWEENTGAEHMKHLSCMKSLNVLCYLKDIKLILMGAVQSLMEASVYAFVVVWPPLLSGLSLPQGLVFAMLMASLSLGAVSLHTISKNNEGSQSLVVALHLATAAFFMLTVLESASTKPSAVLFLVPALMLEFAVGIYFPSFGSLLSVVVPEAVRASVTNLYRLPMNFFMCGILLWSHQSGHQEFFSLFSVCTVMAGGASLAAHVLRRNLKNTQSSHERNVLESLEIY